MRVLAWTEFYWPSVGGGELFTMNLLRGLRRRGFEFMVITGHLGDALPAEEEVDGVPVHRFAFRPALESRDFGALRQIRDELLDRVHGFAPDLVHMTWMGPCGIFYHQLQDRHSLPTLLTLGQHLRGDLSPDSLRGRTLRRATWVAACAAWMRRSLLAQVPELGPRSSVVYHAVPPAPASDLAAAEPQLLCLGRLVSSKGFDLALRAFAVVAGQYPRARMVVAGDGPERGRLEAVAADLGVGQRVRFLGRVSPADSGALIAQSTLVLMPSHEETFGLVALEAAQQGRPIVASDVEGLAEVVADGETGLLVAPGDAAALARAISELLADPDRRLRMGRQAQARVAERFSWDRHLDTYEALYRRLGAQTPA